MYSTGLELYVPVITKNEKQQLDHYLLLFGRFGQWKGQRGLRATLKSLKYPKPLYLTYDDFPMDFLNVLIAESVAVFNMENTVNSPPMMAQTFVRNVYNGIPLSEMTTAIGDI